MGGKKAVEQKAVSGRRQNKAAIADMYKLGGFDNKELNQTQFSSLAARTFGNKAVSREELFGLYEKEAARHANMKKGFQLQREAGALMAAEAAGVGFGALGSGDIADKLDQADELLAERKTNRAEDASFVLRNRLQREADYAEKGAEVAEQVKANKEREKAKLQNTRNLQKYQEETKTRALYEDRLMPAEQGAAQAAGAAAQAAAAPAQPSPLPVNVVNTGEIKASIPEAGDARLLLVVLLPLLIHSARLLLRLLLVVLLPLLIHSALLLLRLPLVVLLPLLIHSARLLLRLRAPLRLSRRPHRPR